MADPTDKASLAARLSSSRPSEQSCSCTPGPTSAGRRRRRSVSLRSSVSSTSATRHCARSAPRATPVVSPAKSLVTGARLPHVPARKARFRGVVSADGGDSTGGRVRLEVVPPRTARSWPHPEQRAQRCWQAVHQGWPVAVETVQGTVRPRSRSRMIFQGRQLPHSGPSAVRVATRLRRRRQRSPPGWQGR